MLAVCGNHSNRCHIFSFLTRVIQLLRRYLLILREETQLRCSRVDRTHLEVENERNGGLLNGIVLYMCVCVVGDVVNILICQQRDQTPPQTIKTGGVYRTLNVSSYNKFTGKV